MTTKTHTLVLGATGYTGRLTVAQLQKRGQPFAIAGRDRARLEALHREMKLGSDVPVLVGDPTRPDTLPGLFTPQIGVVINCVGPFTKLGEPVVKAAIEAGVHYLDITGEQGYLARIVTQYDKAAQAKGCAVIPACGIEYTITNWAAALAAKGLEPLDDLWTATAIENVSTSRGTQLSMFEVLNQPGIGWQDGQRKLKLTASSARQVNFPPPFGSQRAVWSPFGELITIPRHIQVKNMNSYFMLPAPIALAAQVSAPLLPVFSRLMGAALGPLVRGPQTGHVERSRWAIVAEGHSPQGNRRAVLQGTNVYELTAVITSWCAAQLLQPTFKGTGVLGPAQAFDPHAALAYLKMTAGLTASVNGSPLPVQKEKIENDEAARNV